MSSSNPTLQETLSPASALTQLRQLIRRYVSVRGITIVGIWIILFFWLTGLLDYLPVWFGSQDSPWIVRAVFLAVGAGVACYLLVRFIFSPLMVNWSDRSLALVLEKKFPWFQGSLITLVENRNLKQNRAEDALAMHWDIAQDARLQNQVASLAQNHMTNVDVFDALRWDPLRLQCGLLGGLLVMSLLVAFAIPEWTSLWGKRLLLLSDQQWPRRASLRVDGLQVAIPNFSGDSGRQFYRIGFDDFNATIPTGQAAKLLASADLTADLIPSFCSLNYRSADGQSGRANLRRISSNKSDKRQAFLLDGPPLDSIDQNLKLTIRGGDVRISNLELETVSPIEAVNVNLLVTYPEYLRRRSTTTYLDGPREYRNGIRLPEGSDVDLQLRSNVELDRCDFRITYSAKDRPPANGVLEASGQQLTLPIGQLSENVLIELRPWDIHGHCSKDIKQYIISIANDNLPTADLRLEGIGSAVTSLAILPMRLTVQDDHDVRSVTTELIIAGSEPAAIPATYTGTPELSETIDLRDLRDQDNLVLKPGDSLLLRSVVDDFYDLNKSSRISYSNPLTLSVVTPDQLLVLLDRRELELRNRLEQTLVELDQLTSLLRRNVEDFKSTTTETDPKDTSNADGDESLKMALVRLQECKIQAEQSAGELNGIALQVAAINAELSNNRIDSVDRQSRLEDRVRVPIVDILNTDFVSLTQLLNAMENEFRDDRFDASKLGEAIDINLTIVAKLNDVLAAMQDIQDFNEVVDMLREMIDKQEQLLEKTKQEQKRRALDFFK